MQENGKSSKQPSVQHSCLKHLLNSSSKADCCCQGLSLQSALCVCKLSIPRCGITALTVWETIHTHGTHLFSRNSHSLTHILHLHVLNKKRVLEYKVETAGRQEHNPEYRRGRKSIGTYREPKLKQQLMSTNNIYCVSAILSALQIKCLPELSRPQKFLNYCHNIFSSLFLAREKKHLKDSDIRRKSDAVCSWLEFMKLH